MAKVHYKDTPLYEGDCCVCENDIIDEKMVKIFLSALTGNAYRDIPREYGDSIRASIFNQMILNIL
jgi:hypothetical protein